MRRGTRSVLALTAVLLLSACGGDDDAADTATDATGTSTDAGDAADASTIQVVGTDTLKFEPAQLSAAPGEITIELACEPAVNHTLVIEQGDEMVVECAAGETATGTTSLEAGEYTFYCSVAGHRSAGMEGTLSVG